MKNLSSVPLLCLFAWTALAGTCGADPVSVTFPDDTPDPLATLKSGHPRLLATAEQFDAIAKSTDPIRAELNKRIIATAEKMISLPVVPYKTIDPKHGRDLLETARRGMLRIVMTSAAYRLTHDVRFANRAKLEMTTISGFPDWTPTHFLNVGEWETGMAIGYDWCYDTLTPEEKTLFKNALMTKGLVYAPGMYGKHATDSKQLDPNFWFVVSGFNWNEVCNTGMLAAALAVADEEPVVARQVVQGYRAYLPVALHSYGPDGAWPEGPGYWGYGTNYAVLGIAMLESSLGTDFGLSKVEPSFATTGMFRIQMQSPNGVVYNYADVKTTWETSVNPASCWLASRFGPPVAVQTVRNDLQAQFLHHTASQELDRMFPFNTLWLPPAPKGDAEAAPLDAHFHGLADVAVFRSAWNDPDALYLGFKNGQNGVNHSHLDLGSFLLDSDGVRWSNQLGSDNYELPDYFGKLRWNYYRLINFGQSTITPGDTKQDLHAVAPIYWFKSEEKKGGAIADLTPAYPGVAKQMLRAVFFQHRSRVLVQDDITGLSAQTPLNWRMFTKASIAISPDGHTATLTQDGKTLRADLLSPSEAKFSIAPATPPTAAEDQNVGFSVLLATVPANPAVSDVRLGVLLTPVGPKWPANLPVPKLRPLPQPTATAPSST